MQKGKSNRQQAVKSASQVKKAPAGKKKTYVFSGNTATMVRAESHFAVKTSATPNGGTATMPMVATKKRTATETVPEPPKRKLSLSEVADKLQDRELFVEKVKSAKALFKNSKPLPI
ncbi:MAG TPA: hypothetical protein VF623_00585 [Segetibacter sp.]|jgi:hypothetical protein